jgi:predicted nucleic acid-binding Zn ribbon protein
MRYIEANCFECGELFPPSRTDRQFCSGRCRAANFRQIQREKLSTLEKLFALYVPKQEVEAKVTVNLFA